MLNKKDGSSHLTVQIRHSRVEYRTFVNPQATRSNYT